MYHNIATYIDPNLLAIIVGLIVDNIRVPRLAMVLVAAFQAHTIQFGLIMEMFFIPAPFSKYGSLNRLG